MTRNRPGLLRSCKAWGLPVVWRCHFGSDDSNEFTEEAWTFLRAYLEPYVDAYVFTRASYAPDWIPKERLHVIKPSDPPAIAQEPIYGRRNRAQRTRARRAH